MTRLGKTQADEGTSMARMPQRAARRRGLALLTAAVVATLLAMTLGATTAGAAFTITRFDGQASTPSGDPETQAGARADVAVDLRTSITTDADGAPVPDGTLKRATVKLPLGLVGDPQASPTCTAQQLGTGASGICPDGSQVGIVNVHMSFGADFTVGLYNMRPPSNLPAQFAFTLFQTPVYLNAHVLGRSEGYGLEIDIDNISQTLPVVGSEVILWGVPADPVHDALRGNIQGAGICNDDPTKSMPCKANTPRRPFLALPTDCSAGPLPTSVAATSWQEPNNVQRASFLSHLPDSTLTGVDGCENLRFEPTIEVQPDRAAAGEPSGLLVKLGIPQERNPDGLAVPPLRKAVVTFPRGVAVSPSSARGLESCAPSEIRIDDASVPNCPDAAKLGRVEIDTPLLPDPLRGTIYLAKQNDNPFGTTLAIYIVAQGHGVVLKLPGKIEPDAQTGQMTTTFDNNPQLPFSEMRLRFDGGDLAPLSMPTDCGPQTATAQMTPWSSSTPVTVSDTFNVSADGNGAPCGARGFSPGFEAGTTNAAAGKDTTFSLTFSRTDADQELSDIAVDFPEGLLGRIAATTPCPDALAATAACGAESQIASVTTGAGPGNRPIYLPGKGFITGPYKGAPFGMALVVPAVAGPLSLGTVVVRAALFVDRDSTRLRVVSDPMPTILQGIPLQIRKVNVAVDRPGFMFNPTSCKGKTISARINSIFGAAKDVSNHFQVAGCAALKYQPKMVLRVGSRGHVRADVSTPLTVSLDMPKGNTNNKVVSVILPRTMNARLEVLSNAKACSLDQYKQDKCPINIGTATATTPVLKEPLAGKVYLVRNPNRRLPDVIVALKGKGDAQALAIDVTGKVAITKDFRVQTIFDTVPDAPINKFVLNFRSGANGALGTVNNLCVARYRRATVARLAFTAQSGARIARNQTMQVVGCGKASARTRRATSRRTSRRGSRTKR